MTTLARFTEEEISYLEEERNITISDNYKKQISKLREKMLSGKGAFEKSPSRLKCESWAPSLASVIEFIHPVLDRPLYIREYADLMGYPSNFEFVEDSKASYIQSIAQGVPVKFVEWAAKNIYDALNLNLQFEQEADNGSKLDKDFCSIKYMNICNKDRIIEREFTLEEFLNNDNICK